MRKYAVNLAVLLVVLAAHAGVWAWFNRPASMTDWEGSLQAVSFDPHRADQNPNEGRNPTQAQIDEDLALVSTFAQGIRTYSTLNGQDEIPPMAAEHGLSVIAGAWLDKRQDNNEAEIAGLIRIANDNANVKRLMVGNEAVLRGDVTVAELIRMIKKVKSQVDQPVSTAEPWHIWLDHPELVEATDFIAVHLLPYWEGVPADQALDYITRRYDQLARAYPGKKIVISEIGWPSDGRMRDGAVPGLTTEANFIRDFLALARARGWDYSIMEAFDQPWKRQIEGAVGAYWGLYDADRQAKFPLAGDVTPVRDWPLLAAIAAAIALLPLAYFLRKSENLRAPGKLLFGGLLMVAANLMVWTVHYGTTQYLTLPMIAVWSALSFGMVFLLTLILAEGFEMSEGLFARREKRHFTPFRLTPAAERERVWPKVSLHLPICNEPADMVRKTLDSLAKLDYPNLEVLVIDNNTKDPAIWQPVQAYCELLGDRFRFFHLEVCKGFKAGALNFAMAQTAPDAEVVGVIDSDYLVEPDWLKATIPYFDEEKVGFVQAPQDHYDWAGNAFKEMINWEYAGFFHIGMKIRNERDAIIQHGTMTLVRRKAMEAVGNWSTWTICEDAEMGLKLMHEGYKSVYINHRFGRGVTPDSFASYRGQRFRWAFGAMQILRGRKSWLNPFKSTGLTLAQKYHFIMGWAPWFADAMNLVFTLAGLAWTVGLLLLPEIFAFPVTLFLVPTLAVFGFKLAYTFSLYAKRVPCTATQAAGAAIAGLALTYTVGKAFLIGLVKKEKPFLRTPKCEDKPAAIRGLLHAREETTLMLLLWAAAAAVGVVYGPHDKEAYVWVAVMLVQSLPYMAALALSMISAVPGLRWLPFGRPASRHGTLGHEPIANGRMRTPGAGH